MRKLSFVLVLMLFVSTVKAKDLDPILNKLVYKMEKVKPHSVDLKIKIDIEFLKIKERTASLIYNSADDIEIKSDDFMMMPKNGAQMEYLKIIKNRSAAIYEGQENGLTKIKIIPGKNDEGLILANILLDEKTNRIIKMKAFTESNGSFVSKFEYGDNPFDLPSKVYLEFDMKNFQIPAQFTGDIEAVSKNQTKKSENTTGKVVITYSNYKVR